MPLDTFLAQLNWRAAVKSFDQTKKVSDGDFDKLLEAARLAPSSSGLQPWKFVVVKNPEIRQKLREAGYGQAQITEASHLVVMCSKTDLPLSYVDKYIKYIASERGVDVAALAAFQTMISGSVSRQTPEQLANWNARQVYIALGVLLSACAVAGIDACPMEGFDNAQFDEILGLSKLNMASRAIVAIGYRSETDALTKMKKVRFPKNEVVLEV